MGAGIRRHDEVGRVVGTNLASGRGELSFRHFGVLADRPRVQLTEVFCCFFSKKKRLLPFTHT
jgi:hypothetical protein